MAQYTQGLPRMPKSVKTYLEHVIPEGSRNQALAAAARQMNAAGYTEAEATPILAGKAIQVDGLGEKEVLETIKQQFSYAPRAAPCQPSEAFPPPPHPAASQAKAQKLPEPLPEGLAVLLKAMFKPGEYVSISAGHFNGEKIVPDGGTTIRVEKLLAQLEHKPIEQFFPGADATFLRVNPMRKLGTKADQVSAWRHGLIDGDKGSKEEQYARLLNSGLPLAGILDTGNKSLHALPVINAPTRKEYDRRVALLLRYFAGSGIDPQTKDPNHWTRCPDAQRNIYEGGKIARSVYQRLVSGPVNLDVSWDQWEKTVGALLEERNQAELKAAFGSQPAPEPVSAEALKALQAQHAAQYTWQTLPFPDPLREEAFHGLAGDVVHILDPVSAASKESMLVQFLVAAGNWLDRSVVLKNFGVHYANEFVVLVGETGEARKGTSWECVFHVFDTLTPAWTDRVWTSAVQSGEVIVDETRDAGVRRHRNGKTYNDPGVADKRFLLVEEEFPRLLAAMSWKGSTLGSILNQIWDARKRIQTKSKSGGSVTATGVHGSLIGHITPGAVAEGINSKLIDSGFANRILWVAAQGKKIDDEALHWIDWNDGEYVDIQDQFTKIDQNLVEPFRVPAPGAGPLQRAMDLDKDAKKIWKEYRADEERNPFRAKSTLLGYVLRRSSVHIMRLALIYAALDATAIITAAHLRAALAVWDYCRRSAGWIFGFRTNNADADAILWQLMRTAGGLGRGEIQSQIFRNHASKHRMDLAFTALKANGLADFEMRSSQGRAIEHWFYTPPL